MIVLGLVVCLFSSGLTPVWETWAGVSFLSVATAHLRRLPQSHNAIRGRITNTAGRGIERLRVELQDEVEMTVAQTYTDSLGRYAFSGLSLGTFIVKVHTDGIHASRSARITLTPARIGASASAASHQEQLDFVLPTLAEAKGPAVPGNTGVAFAQDVPENARKLYEKAVDLLDQNKTEEGVEALKGALKLFVDYYLAWERLGIEYVKLEHYDAARLALTQALRVNQNSASSLYALGYTQCQQRQWQEAVESLSRSLRLAPASANASFAHYYLGLALLKLDKPTESEPHLKQSYELGRNSTPSEVHLHLAQLYSNSKRYKEAAAELEVYLKRAPNAKDADNIRNLIKQLRAKAAK